MFRPFILAIVRLYYKFNKQLIKFIIHNGGQYTEPKHVAVPTILCENI